MNVMSVNGDSHEPMVCQSTGTPINVILVNGDSHERSVSPRGQP